MRLTDSPDDDLDPTPAPDGKTIAYMNGDNYLWLMGPDGKGKRQLLPDAEILHVDWSPDSRWIAVSRTTMGHKEDVFIVPADGGEAVNATLHPNDDFQPRWTDDGKRLSFASRTDDGQYMLKYIWLTREEYWKPASVREEEAKEADGAGRRRRVGEGRRRRREGGRGRDRLRRLERARRHRDEHARGLRLLRAEPGRQALRVPVRDAGERRPLDRGLGGEPPDAGLRGRLRSRVGSPGTRRARRASTSLTAGASRASRSTRSPAASTTGAAWTCPASSPSASRRSAARCSTRPGGCS